LLVRKRLRKAEGQEDALDDIERDAELVRGLSTCDRRPAAVA
jgi:hypothetical protein